KWGDYHGTSCMGCVSFTGVAACLAVAGRLAVGLDRLELEASFGSSPHLRQHHGATTPTHPHYRYICHHNASYEEQAPSSAGDGMSGGWKPCIVGGRISPEGVLY
ncbi:hypothetical protein, partial [Xanthomonas phaseoli]|uniref:hypothetical protein n=1 Tax=Xanthomonas phaseoli TaxID=1985254 RepID=UPI001EE66B86